MACERPDDIAPTDPDFMLSLRRGLSVLETFSQLGQPLSVAQIAADCGLSRPVVHRCLHTLERCGYVGRSGRSYTVLPHVLLLANAYLSPNSLPVIAQPELDRLRDSLKESCSMGKLDGFDLVYVARASSPQIMAIGLHVGSRLPAHYTSMGRVLISVLPEAERQRLVASAALEARTERSIVEPGCLLNELRRVTAQGYCMVNGELEVGLQSIAVPVRGAGRQIVAALNVATSTAKFEAPAFLEFALPALRRAASAIETLTAPRL